MIEHIISFDPIKDNTEVVPGLVIDINEALRTGIVLDTGLEVEYNGIEDPNLIRGRVEDVFGAIDERNAVVGKEIKKSKATAAVTKESSDLPN